MREVLDGSRSLRDELTALYRRAAQFAFTHQLHMRLSMPLHLSQVSGLSDETQAKIGACHGQMLQVIRDRVAAARDRGELRDVSLDAAVGMIQLDP